MSCHGKQDKLPKVNPSALASVEQRCDNHMRITRRPALSRMSQRITLGVLLALIGLFVAAKLRYSGTATVKLPAADCNADLWKHVYAPERLRVIEACTAVDGRVVSVHRASDGDLHIGLDPEQKSILNLV